MRKRIWLAALMMVALAAKSLACTNLIVGKAASTDGSVLITYSADSFGMFGFLRHYETGKHNPGEKIDVRDWDSNKYLGQIDQAPVTYNVIGNINEHQVSIAETTFGGRPELVNEQGLIDYGSLIYLGLQRSRTAREAIKVMTDLVREYGYYSSGETFTIADPNEAWIMEMIGKGPGVKGAVWVAVRVPDDCIAAHANQSRIHQFNLNDKENCIYSPDVISFAREKGYFNGKNKDFSFADAYAPADFGALRFCEARVWSFYRKHNSTMDSYLSYIKGETKEPIPLYIKPDKKLSLQDVQNDMRDHYEGTPLDMTKDLGAGPYKSPYRPSPLTFKVDGKEYFNERPISTQQAGFTFVSQLRSSLPDAVGGIMWFGLDDANMIAYVPVYCCTDKVPVCFDRNKGADGVTFSFDNSFWVCNWVSNMIYPRYDLMIQDLRNVQKRLEDGFFSAQGEVESKAVAMYEKNPAEAKNYLTNYTVASAENMHKEWRKLGEFLIVKYNDIVVKKVKDGKFELTPDGLPEAPNRPGYPEDYNRKVIQETGDRYKVPEK